VNQFAQAVGMVWMQFVPQGSKCRWLGPQCGNVEVVELLGSGAYWEVVRSLGALLLEGANTGLSEGVSSP
jgi:hypothetical protein